MNKNIRRRIISLLLSLNILTLAGCAKKVDCNVEGDHIHVYTSSDGINRYVKGENETVGKYGKSVYTRTDDYLGLNSDNRDLYYFISSHNLVNIEDNLDSLRLLESNLRDYYNFEYYDVNTEEYTTTKYSFGDRIEETHKRDVKTYYWTNNPHHSNLTGKYHVSTHVIYGYNIVRNSKGHLTIQKSGPVQDIDTLIQMGYKYVDTSLYQSMNRNNYYKSIGLTNYNPNNEVYVRESDNSYSQYDFQGYYADYLESVEYYNDRVVSTRRIVEDDDDDYDYDWYDDYDYDWYDDYDYDYGSDWNDDYDNGYDWYYDGMKLRLKGTVSSKM